MLIILAAQRAFCDPALVVCFLKVLVEVSNLGGSEVEVAEITLRANYSGRGHPQGSIEISYLLSGPLTQSNLTDSHVSSKWYCFFMYRAEETKTISSLY